MIHHRLIIMRHAKSDWSTDAKTDFDRPLRKRGRKSAASIATWLKKNNIVPDVITCSPAKRAKDTALIVCKNLEIPSSIIKYDERIYESSLAELLDVVTDFGRDAVNFLLVGHNPGLDDLLNYLSMETPQRNGSGKLMTTAAVAILDFGSGPVNAKRKGAKLVQLVRPKDL